MLDIIAWIILLVFWLFCGAFFFTTPAGSYKQALQLWAAANTFIIVAGAAGAAIFWALERVFTNFVIG